MSNTQNSLPMALLCAREATMAYFAPIFREYNITEQQWRVLRTLVESDDSGMDISALARKCRILQPSMSRLLHTLEARDLVWRRAHDMDQRSVLIALTRQGRDVFDSIMPQVEAGYKKIISQIGQDDMKELFRISDRIVQSLNGNAKHSDANQTKHPNHDSRKPQS